MRPIPPSAPAIKNCAIVNFFFCWMIHFYHSQSDRPDQINKLESDRKTPFFQAIALPQIQQLHKRAKSSRILN